MRSAWPSLHCILLGAVSYQLSAVSSPPSTALAAIAYVRGDLDEARKRLEAVTRLLPDDRDAINRLGHIHRMQGRLDEAEQSYRRVLERPNGKPPPTATWGWSTGSVATQAKARELWTKSRDLYQQIGIPHMVDKVQGWIDDLSDEPDTRPDQDAQQGA